MTPQRYRELVEQNSARVEDAWHRRQTELTCQQELNILGYPFLVRSNAAAVLALAQVSQGRFSQCPPIPGAPAVTLDLLVLDLPGDEDVSALQLENQFQTVASGSRGMINLGRWGSIFVDWEQRSAFGYLSRALLAHPAIASRHALDTFMLVALLRQPLGMLHASGLVAGQRVLLLIGHHGAGKSTTALHLLRAGYRLISDSLIFVRAAGEQLEILGYGVGELKLTSEGHALFPELPAQAADVSIDGRRKPVFSLRELMPERVETSALTPAESALCLVRRAADTQSRLLPLDHAETLQGVISSTSYLDEPHVMAQNLAVIDRLIHRAQNFSLELGRDPQGIVDTLNGIWHSA